MITTLQETWKIQNKVYALYFCLTQYHPHLIGRKSTWIINIFRNKRETPKIIIDAAAASHKNRLIEKIRLSSINWLNRMCCLKVLSWIVKYCHFSDERKLSKLYSLVTCLAMQTFHSLLRAQTQGRTSQNGQQHGNVAPKSNSTGIFLKF